MNIYKSLFRKQAVEQNSNPIHGEVILLPKISHVVLFVALSIWIVALFVWLFSNSYTRKETVTGWLEPTTGVVRSYSKNEGVIDQLLVKEGDYVAKGQQLVIIKNDKTMGSGKNIHQEMLIEYENQLDLLLQTKESEIVLFENRNREIGKRISSNEKNIELLGKQLDTLYERNKLTKNRLRKFKELKQKGYLSKEDFDTIHNEKLLLQSQIQQILREKNQLEFAISQSKSELEILPTTHKEKLTALHSQESSITQAILQLKSNSSHIVVASTSGTISNLSAKVGHRTVPAQPLLAIIPDGAKLIANLVVPVRAAGFITEGQKIELRYDAFAYQKFGLYDGTVDQVSSTILLPTEQINSPIVFQEPIYLVTADISSTEVSAYGRQFSLKPGMTFSADIWLDTRTMMDWLLDPIYSLRGKT